MDMDKVVHIFWSYFKKKNIHIEVSDSCTLSEHSKSDNSLRHCYDCFLNSRYFSQKKTFKLEFSCKSVHFSFKFVWCILKGKENNKGLQYLDSSPKNNNSVKNYNDTS